MRDANSPSSLPPEPTGESRVDPYYGYEEVATLCATYVTHVFVCSDLPTLSTAAPAWPLAKFIAYTLHRTQAPSPMPFVVLYLLTYLKSLTFDPAPESSGHCIFLSALMLLPDQRVIATDVYSSIVDPTEVRQMALAMRSCLEWPLEIGSDALKDFETRVRSGYGGSAPRSYTTLSPLPSTSSRNMVVGAMSPSSSIVHGNRPNVAVYADLLPSLNVSDSPVSDASGRPVNRHVVCMSPSPMSPYSGTMPWETADYGGSTVAPVLVEGLADTSSVARGDTTPW